MVNFTSAETIEYLKTCHVFGDEIEVVDSFPSRKYFINHIVVFATCVIIAILTIILNLVTIITFRSSNHLKKKTYHFLIFLQSINDLGIGLITSPLLCSALATEIMVDVNCEEFYIFLRVFFTSAGFSIAILSAMNIERYSSIVHPVFHRNKVTKKKLSTYITCICVICVCITIATIPIGSLTLLTNFISVICMLHLVSTVYLYKKIFSVARVQLKRNDHGCEEQKNRNDNYQINYRAGDPDIGDTSCQRYKLNNLKDIPDNPRDFSNHEKNKEDHDESSRNDEEDRLHLHLNGPENIHRLSIIRGESTLSDNQSIDPDNQNENSHHDDRTEKHNDILVSRNCQETRLVQQRTSQDNREDHDNVSDNENNTANQIESRLPHHEPNRQEDPELFATNEGRNLDIQRISSMYLENSSINQHNRPELAACNDDNVSDLDRISRDISQLNTPSNQNISHKIAKQEILSNFKLAKSCLLVVICSFISFISPPILAQIQFDKFDATVIASWCATMVLLNSTLDSLIFFWKNKMLRKEAIKTFKHFWGKQ